MPSISFTLNLKLDNINAFGILTFLIETLRIFVLSDINIKNQFDKKLKILI